MKILICTYKEGELYITGAAVPSVAEAKKIPRRLLRYPSCWWLRTACPQNPGCVAFVDMDGVICSRGQDPAAYIDYIRPILTIQNLEQTPLYIGSRFRFGGKEFEIVDETMAFCVEDIGTDRFCVPTAELKTNEYEHSSIMQLVSIWFDKARGVENRCDGCAFVRSASVPNWDEVEMLPAELMEYDNWWWLSSDVEEDLKAAENKFYEKKYKLKFIHSDAVIDRVERVTKAKGCVRPVLHIGSMMCLHYAIGDSFIFGGKEFEIVTEQLAFCKEDIGICQYPYTRKRVLTWFKEAIKSGGFLARTYSGQEDVNESEKFAKEDT